MNILRLRMVWERLAKEDPFWAVLTTPDKAGNRWQVEEFFQTGITEVEACLAEIEQHRPGFKRGSALDFGCGVGRLTRALARSFATATGVDVAQRMIELAERHKPADAEDSLRYVHNPRSDLQDFPNAAFDLVFSLITLQHIPPPLIEVYLREFVRVTRSGGLIYFQLPSFAPNAAPEVKKWSWYPPTLYTRLKRWTGRWFRRFTGIGDTMHMNTLPEERVRTLLDAAGAELVSTRRQTEQDGCISVIYLAEVR